MVVSAIEKEAELVCTELRTSSNPGKVWETWKANIKTQLQAIQQKLRHQDTRAVEDARIALDQAAARFQLSAHGDDCALFRDALLHYKETITRTSQYNQDTAFNFQAANAEKSTKYFFRPVDTTLRRVSIEGVVTPGGGI